MDSKTLRECAAAYNAVYNPELRQEVEEQQEFENWVNSLVEEGYDLSEYTWEEMYESYITEIGVNFGGQAAVDKVRAKAAAERTSTANINAARAQRFGSGGAPSAGKDKMGNVAKPAAKPGNEPYKSRFAGARDAAVKKAQAIKGSPVVGSGPAAAKPAPTAPAAKPAASKPAPTAPATKPAPAATATPAAKPSAMDQWAKANPRLAQAQKIRQQGGSRAEVNKSLYNKGTAAATSTPTVVKAGFDMFDIVKGYLLDEGYAETEQAAIAIMANMSEEWKFAIISEQQLDEISQKTATRAYAASRTGEFEGADSDRDLRRSDNLEKHIKRKFGDKAVKHAERAADAQTFGRKDASGRRKQSPKPRIEKSDYRTTEDGKMNKQDQRELKTDLRIRRDRRLRAKEN